MQFDLERTIKKNMISLCLQNMNNVKLFLVLPIFVTTSLQCQVCKFFIYTNVLYNP